ncbi:hypothetical protein [Novosphingobium sp. KACC 22771]|uniref:hypothetical protein n=1 Tax=Novosphingobium sp. KACC 22771 TaxID=3025670 RepID=UPI002366B708|nr:hypothetical protein [Novosphingobium sp. KACC 22771]WDF72584.1 hypothetical protein PQ467_00640 [Novosphingobium sp. KACC 22771]
MPRWRMFDALHTVVLVFVSLEAWDRIQAAVEHHGWQLSHEMIVGLAWGIPAAALFVWGGGKWTRPVRQN